MSVDRPELRRRPPSCLPREVRAELRQVAWPGQAAMVTHTTVVLAALVLTVATVFALNLGLGRALLSLLHP